jgi:hypothetical protein
VRYYYVPQRKLVVCTTQRAASASMAESLAPASMRSEVIAQKRVLRLKNEGAKVLLWIRDPLDRIACAYPIFGKTLNADGFAEKVLSEINPHWSPQTSLHRMAGHGFLPTHVYPFESLAESWPMEIGYKYPLQHVGAQPSRLSWDELSDPMSASLICDIVFHWRLDLAMHDIALGSWESGRQPEEITTVQRGGEKDAA